MIFFLDIAQQIEENAFHDKDRFFEKVKLVKNKSKSVVAKPGLGGYDRRANAIAQG